MLIFSHYSEDRDGKGLLEDLAHALLENNARPDHVIFTTYQEREDGRTRIGKLRETPLHMSH
jgi:folylpolyglutamate synthase